MLMGTLVRLVAVAFPAAVIIIGLIQLNRLRAVNGRIPRTAAGLALALGGFCALIVELALAGLAGFDRGVRPEDYLWALPLALGAGGVVTLAGLAGYGILAGAHASPAVALLGILLVPVALGVSAQVANDYAGRVEESERSATAAQQRAQNRELCSTLTLTVDVISVEYQAHKVDRLTIDLEFVAAADVVFEPGGFVTANRDPYDVNAPDFFSKLTTDVAVVLKSGQPSTYRLVLEHDSRARPIAGPWELKVWLKTGDGEVYICPVLFDVPPMSSASAVAPESRVSGRHL
jgi:hypothetical protein